MDEGKGNPNPKMIGHGYNPDNIVETIPIHNDGGDW